MPRKDNSSLSMMLAIVFIVAIGGFLETSSLGAKVSLVATGLVIVAFLEAVGILAAYILFQRRRRTVMESVERD